MDCLVLIGRYLKTRRIAWVASLCIAVAVIAMIVVTSVMAGFRARIVFHVRGTEPDLSFRLKSRVPRDHFAAVVAELRGEMEEAGGPIVALSPRLEAVGLIATKVVYGTGAAETRHDVAAITGIDFGRERKVIPFDRILGAVPEVELRPIGSLDIDPLAQVVPGIFTGRHLANRLSLRVIAHPSDIVAREASVLTGRLVLDAQGQQIFEPSNMIFRMAGAFESGRDDFDAVHTFVDIMALHRMRYGPDSTRPDSTRIHARLTHSAKADVRAVADRLAASHRTLDVKTWEHGNRTLIDALDVENRTMGIVIGFIVVLAVSLVLGLLYMMVVEKTRDIGILRSMGFTRGHVVLTFLGYGLALGLIGSVLGVVLGVLIGQNLNEVLDALGLEVFSKRVPYRFREIPVVLDTARVAMIFTLSVTLSFLAGAIAAWKAARMDPVVCLSYE